ncbi:alpha/beta hydrolase, partial [Pseudomonas sp. MWU13-2625]
SALSLDSARDPRLPALLGSPPAALWAVRYSSYGEDQADSANAGLSTTYLRVASADVPARIGQLRDAGVEEVVVQRFIQPTLSGIAFVRHLAVELEWVEGHLERLADGQVSPQRAILSRLGPAWESGAFASTQGLDAKALWDFL